MRELRQKAVFWVSLLSTRSGGGGVGGLLLLNSVYNGNDFTEGHAENFLCVPWNRRTQGLGDWHEPKKAGAAHCSQADSCIWEAAFFSNGGLKVFQGPWHLELLVGMATLGVLERIWTKRAVPWPLHDKGNLMKEKHCPFLWQLEFVKPNRGIFEESTTVHERKIQV